MPSNRAVGAAPLLTGLVLVFQAMRALVENGVSLWSVPGLIGGCAAVAVGLGVLLGWGAFTVDGEGIDSSTGLVLVGIAALTFVVGGVLAVA